MKELIKRGARSVLFLPFGLLDKIAAGYARILGAMRSSYAPLWIERQTKNIVTRTMHISHINAAGSHKFQFFTPNALCQFRAETFSTKEPETLAWIDEFGGDGALFDIGANVGLYSIYYAKTQPGLVYSFEPSLFNLPLLAKNVGINELGKKIRIFPNPLSDSNGFGEFALQMMTEGGSLSSFGVAYGHDGKPLKTVFSYSTPGFTLDSLIESGLIPERPRLIKLDVDGIEHLILRGARATLSHPDCVSVLVEVNSEFVTLATEVHSILESSGFRLKALSNAAGSGESGETSNQIWVKL